MVKTWLRLILLVALSLQGQGPTLHEADHVERLAPKYGATATEFRLADGTRVDMMTGSHAIEVDYARKWAEAIGQSLHYAAATGKQPGIILLLEDERDARYVRRLQNVIGRVWFDSAREPNRWQRITLWTERVD
jgi:hypothetical protein